MVSYDNSHTHNNTPLDAFIIKLPKQRKITFDQRLFIIVNSTYYLIYSYRHPSTAIIDMIIAQRMATRTNKHEQPYDNIYYAVCYAISLGRTNPFSTQYRSIVSAYSGNSYAYHCDSRMYGSTSFPFASYTVPMNE